MYMFWVDLHTRNLRGRAKLLGSFATSWLGRLSARTGDLRHDAPRIVLQFIDNIDAGTQIED